MIRWLVAAAMLALAVWCGLHWSLPRAIFVWCGLAAGLCVAGAVLLARQPIGVSTAGGRVGAGVLRWGYKVGRGKLPGIVLLSWLVWMVLGGAVIGGTVFRGEPLLPWMCAGWGIDVLALLFLTGRAITNTPRSRMALLPPIAAVLGMVVGSALLWRVGTPAAQEAALLLGGAPIPVLAAAYGVFLGAMLLGGRKGGWR